MIIPKDTYNRYLDTFFELYRKNPEFQDLFQNSKGFCLPHFADLVETAETLLSDKEKKSFYDSLFALMTENLQRITEDLEWFCDKLTLETKMLTGKTQKMPFKEACKKLPEAIPLTRFTKQTANQDLG